MFEIFVTAMGLSIFNSYTMNTSPAPEDFYGIPLIYEDGSTLAPICLNDDCSDRNMQVTLIPGQEYEFELFDDNGQNDFAWTFHPADLNMDNRVNFFDITFFIQHLYDYNVDGSIDYADFYDLLENYHLLIE